MRANRQRLLFSWVAYLLRTRGSVSLVPRSMVRRTDSAHWCILQLRTATPERRAGPELKPWGAHAMNKLLVVPSAFLALALAPPGDPHFRVNTVLLDSPPVRLIVAPLDAGSTPDVAVLLQASSSDYELLTLKGFGNGRLIPAELRALQQLGYLDVPSLAVGHVNQDAWLDLGITTMNPDGIFLGNGALGFTDGGWLPTFGGSQHGVGFTDVDDDGDLDSALLVYDFGGWYLDIGVNAGDGTLSGDLFVTAPGTYTSVARLLFADVDGDGRDATFVVGGSGLATSGFPGSSAASELLVAGNLGEVIAAHFDGDDRLDLAVAAPELDGVYVLMNDGSGGFPSASFYKTGRKPESLAAEDFDGDGNVDLAVAHRNGNSVGFLLGDGAGAFASGGKVAVGAGPIDIEYTDLDLDGDADLIVALNGAASLQVLLNVSTP